MSTVKSFRFSDVEIKRIEEIETKLGVSFSDLLKDFLEDSYFHVSGIEKRQRCYYVHDYDSDLYSPFYLNPVDAYSDFINNISFGWSTEAVIECCYGPSVIID